MGFLIFQLQSLSVNFTLISLKFLVLVKDVISFMGNFFVAIGHVSEEIPSCCMDLYKQRKL